MDNHEGVAVKDLKVVKRCYPGEYGGTSGRSYECSRNVKILTRWFSVCITESRKFYEKKKKQCIEKKT